MSTRSRAQGGGKWSKKQLVLGGDTALWMLKHHWVARFKCADHILRDALGVVNTK